MTIPRFARLTMGLAAFAIAGGTTLARAADVPFQGAVGSECVLTVGTPGRLVPTNDGGTPNDTLTSSGAGGISGTVTALAVGSTFELAITAPTDWTATALVDPNADPSADSFTATYSATGATIVTNVASTIATLLGIGTTTVSVDLVASKATGFPAGVYNAIVVVTCEDPNA